MHYLVLKNSKIVYPDKTIQADLGITAGKISGIGKNLAGDKILDLKGKYILPGIIDAHVHFREPGYAEKEDWLTGSMAAASGGVTTVLDMSNTNPATTTAGFLDGKRAIANSKSVIDFGFHFGATNDNLDEIKKIKSIASVKFFLGSSTGNMLVKDDAILFEELKVLSKKNIPATVHAEDESIIKRETERLKASGRMDARDHSEARPPEAALSSVEKIVSLSKNAGNRLHICHVSTKGETDFLASPKNKTKKISVEVTPHHLLLTTKDYKKLGTLAKTNPPIRSEADRKALWAALNKGIIDVIASDHAPHTIESKNQDIWSAPSGVPGVETLLPLMLNEVNKGNISINKLVELTSQNPARIFKIKNKGAIKKGFDADLVVVDMKKTGKIDNSRLFTKCGWSPFDGRKIKGWPVMTLVRGTVVYEDGNINKFRGREVSYD